ncbi:NAD(P)/FAD-dependent oxidoreductase [Pseudomonas sp. FEN]|uniref:NAD(P)/FAD-dependent oxidoreductase n=1 Tax=Pseudomonas sp. FEN TaxID=2767468 RepID=UPI001747E3AD|nr:tryptophan 7-halogenase [Pseudomonas sp. FEN]
MTYLGDLDLLDRQQLLNGEGLWRQLAKTRLLSSLCQAHDYRPGTSVHGMDASSGRLSVFHGLRWAAVGDAALSFDPLSSQGIATALYCGQHCAQAVHAALQGDPAALPGYAELLTRIYAAYLDNRQQFYGMEKRWSESIFWNPTLGLEQPFQLRGTRKMSVFKRHGTDLDQLSSPVKTVSYDFVYNSCYSSDFDCNVSHTSLRIAPSSL